MILSQHFRHDRVKCIIIEIHRNKAKKRFISPRFLEHRRNVTDVSERPPVRAPKPSTRGFPTPFVVAIPATLLKRRDSLVTPLSRTSLNPDVIM
jgi:hypothetical protein